MRIGAKLPNFGPLVRDRGLAAMAAELEAAGYDSIWLSDHIVIPADPRSRYPFSASGKASSRTDTPWYDAIVCLAQLAAVTRRAELGIGVLVLPLREPVTLAKQLASIDVLSGGRVTLGVGAGWLAEEFEPVGVPFETRGRRMDEAIEVMRRIWTGAPDAFEGRHFGLPAGLGSLPRPEHDIPIVVGGMSAAALRRAAKAGDGWFAFQNADAIDLDQLAKGAATLGGGRLVLRVAGPAERVASLVPGLRDAGVHDLVVDVDWSVPEGPKALHDTLREG
ncbi:hypothetical protein GCM10009555_061490 [Acrocarpospora macrocephala]|uniref:LLM class F420-dependent oxidoreductase n=1 Tax=Acrocarpospora macrocephala TaxID=150177 RepID=A0A5M3WNB6_9ACTN|nr:TIGR03619 family F420-dependent LLM class oxidoreductase [Acrocarpospora macrocephala]GES09592.1 LLM class F420-dependent oxidoreductase [Acrocarpospora macrocephala]